MAKRPVVEPPGIRPDAAEAEALSGSMLDSGFKR